jgi:hypothetical protein
MRDQLQSLTPIQLDDVLNQHSQHDKANEHQTNIVQSQEKTLTTMTSPKEVDKQWHSYQPTPGDYANNPSQSC